MLRAGIVGLGVGEQHIAGYELSGECRVTALCDIDRARLAQVGERNPGRRLTHEPADVLTDPDIDVVSIASYDDAHCEQVVTALDAGKHVFVEKPICVNATELEQIADTLDRNPGRLLSSNLILRRAPRFLAVRNQVRSGKFGEVYLLEGDYNYGRIAKILKGWRGRQAAYSVMHGGGIHMIDLLTWMLGQQPVEAFAYGTNLATRDSGFGRADTIIGLLTFKSGAIAKVSANFPCVYPHHHNIAIYGTKATFQQTRGGSHVYTDRDEMAEPAVVRDAYPGTHKGDMIPGFVRAITRGTDPEVTTQEVLDVMAVSIAIDEASRSGTPQRVRYRTTH